MFKNKKTKSSGVDLESKVRLLNRLDSEVQYLLGIKGGEVVVYKDFISPYTGKQCRAYLTPERLMQAYRTALHTRTKN